MVTQGEFDQLARRVLFLEKDNARLAERIRRMEDPQRARTPMLHIGDPGPVKIATDPELLARLEAAVRPLPSA